MNTKAYPEVSYLLDSYPLDGYPLDMYPPDKKSSRRRNGSGLQSARRQKRINRAERTFDHLSFKQGGKSASAPVLKRQIGFAGYAVLMFGLVTFKG